MWYVHDELVGSGNQLQFVLMEELFRDISAESVPCVSRRRSPAFGSVIWVAPEQITHRPVLRDIPDSVELLDRLDVGQRWR